MCAHSMALTSLSTPGEICALIGDNGAGQVDARENPFRRGPAGRGADPSRRQAGRLQFPQRRPSSRHCDGLSGSRSCRRSLAFRESRFSAGRSSCRACWNDSASSTARQCADRRANNSRALACGFAHPARRSPLSPADSVSRSRLRAPRCGRTASSSWTSPRRPWASCRLGACLI